MTVSITPASSFNAWLRADVSAHWLGCLIQTITLYIHYEAVAICDIVILPPGSKKKNLFEADERWKLSLQSLHTFYATNESFYC